MLGGANFVQAVLRTDSSPTPPRTRDPYDGFEWFPHDLTPTEKCWNMSIRAPQVPGPGIRDRNGNRAGACVKAERPGHLPEPSL